MDEASPAGLLAVLPNGEAVRARTVHAVTIEEQAGLLGQEEPRFKVLVVLDDGSRRAIGHDLGAGEAADLARRTGRVVNDALKG